MKHLKLYYRAKMPRRDLKKLLILLTLSTLLIPSIILSQDPPEEFQYEQSTLQAFYFFTQVTLNGNLLESNDWVAAFNGDICVGSRQWDVSNCGGNLCDLPAMGNDGAESHFGYMELGDLPTFKIFDTSSGNIYDAIPSQAVDPWSNNNFSMNDLLEGFIPGCTDNMACNYNAEATQDDDSCAYEYDCTGECGGDSTVDMCGTCDNDPSNNCTQDCLGDWGGLAVNDECGVCEGPGAIYECGCEDIADLYPGFSANQHHIAGGIYHSLALTASGEVIAWGYNTYGQTNVPDNLIDGVAIAGGAYHSLALTASGEVVAWGYNNYGQIDIPDNLSDVVAIAGGYYHSLALTASGEVVAWGYNNYGQIDIPDNLEGLVYSDACDCDGNIEDCFGECGGIAEEDCAGDCEGDSEILTYCADTDGDGLGNPDSDTDLCNGLIDETWVFNCDDSEPDCITNDTYICGACGVGIEEGACDCEGNVLDACGICNGEEECFIYSRDLHVGSNLISFWALPADTSIENVMSSLEGHVIGVIGEGMAASQINPGQWIGSLTGVEYTSGYWVKLDNDESILTLEGYLNENTLYDLQIGTNLISYPFPDTMGIAESIPDVMEGYFTGIIGEGVATSQIEPFTWVGSLTEFRGGNGYWAKVTFPFEFNFNIPDELSRESIISNNIKELPIWIDFNQSTEQAFYFIEDIEIIELGDIVSSYCNNTKVGSRVWNGAYTDIPAMGNDNSDLTKDYCTSSSVPEFRVEKVNGETYALTGDIPLWESNGLHILSTLQEIIILPESYSLAAGFPNPFNPTTTINFTIPSDKEVSISVYNLNGRDVVTLANGSYDAGYHSVIWNADSYSSGVYFVRMIAGNFISTKKLILLK